MRKLQELAKDRIALLSLGFASLLIWMQFTFWIVFLGHKARFSLGVYVSGQNRIYTNEVLLFWHLVRRVGCALLFRIADCFENTAGGNKILGFSATVCCCARLCGCETEFCCTVLRRMEVCWDVSARCWVSVSWRCGDCCVFRTSGTPQTLTQLHIHHIREDLIFLGGGERGHVARVA